MGEMTEFINEMKQYKERWNKLKTLLSDIETADNIIGVKSWHATGDNLATIVTFMEQLEEE